MLEERLAGPGNMKTLKYNPNVPSIKCPKRRIKMRRRDGSFSGMALARTNNVLTTLRTFLNFLVIFDI